MGKAQELEYLKDRINAKILEIEDPRNHTEDEIIGSFFREIMWLARRYTRPTVEFEDLVIEGIMGLLDAIKRFDPEKAKGKKRAFHNLAIVRIKSGMFEYLLTNSNLYTIPVYMSRAVSLVGQIRRGLQSVTYEGDPQEDLIRLEGPFVEQGFPKDLLEEVTELKGKLARVAEGAKKSYEDMVEVVLKVERDIEDYEHLEEEMDGPENSIAQKEFVEKFLEGLNPDARSVISQLLEGETLETVGQNMGFTRERARQIKEETLEFFHRTRMFQDTLDPGEEH